MSPEEAARTLFRDPKAAVDFEPDDLRSAARAVEEFSDLFAAAPGVFTQALLGARAGAETLSQDPLQGLAEIIQNADDAGATFVEFSVHNGYLIAEHDGQPLTLSDVLSIATPWLSNKSDDATVTGRYGIGLMTLRALSDVLEVHSSPYHLRLGKPTITSLEPDSMPRTPRTDATTAVCVPVDKRPLGIEAVCDWVGAWDDAALLFLQSVRSVTVRGEGADTIRDLRLTWSDEPPTTSVIGGFNVEVSRRHAAASDGRKWLVHSAEVPKPAESQRTRKATASKVPLGLALPLHAGDRGLLYAGLPLLQCSVPLRINAQFDPTTSRTDLPQTEWNRAMIPLLADLWVEVTEDLFNERPSGAWGAVPLPGDPIDEASPIVSQLEDTLLDRGRQQLSSRVRLPIDGALVPLSDIAVEEQLLTGVLTDAETAAVADLDATLPTAGRDDSQRWRKVLDDWREAGNHLPAEVTAADAVHLLGHPERSHAATIALAAACIRAELTTELSDQPFVITASGTRIMPPSGVSLRNVVLSDSPLAEHLGVAIRLHPVHLGDEGDALEVLTWLRANGAVLDEDDDQSVVRQLSDAGLHGDQLEDALDDQQLRALRDAMEAMPKPDRVELGPGIGRAIRVSAFRYASDGTKESLPARPADLYLPLSIDKEPHSFARAAAETPGLVWADSRYSKQLKSSIGRPAGLGPQKFLGLLGAQRIPRLLPHPLLESRYSDPRRGLLTWVPNGPSERSSALRALGATYTLDDLDSPDLRAVVENIASEPKARRRRDRASALLGTLSRQWDSLADDAVVTAAVDYYNWNPKGEVRAFWAWAVGSVAWLDDTNGDPSPPLELRLRSHSTMAVHGSEAPGYLREEFEQDVRREVLDAIGVVGEPSTADLVGRLRDLASTDAQSSSIRVRHSHRLRSTCAEAE